MSQAEERDTFPPERVAGARGLSAEQGWHTGCAEGGCHGAGDVRPHTIEEGATMAVASFFDMAHDAATAAQISASINERLGPRPPGCMGF